MTDLLRTRLSRLICLLPTLAGCNPGGAALDVWATDRRQADHEPPGAEFSADIYSPEAGQVTLAGAINETLDFRLMLRHRGPFGASARIEVSPLRSEAAIIEPSAVQLFRVETVHVARWPGWHIRSVPPDRRVADVPDVLVPLAMGAPLALRGNATAMVWVDLHIPKGTPPGEYSGSLAITTGVRAVRAIELRLTVWPFVLPDSTRVAMLAELDHVALFRQSVRHAGASLAPERMWADSAAGAELDQALLGAMRLLQTHRVTPLLPRFRPVVKVDADAEASVDWTDYDRVVSDYLSGRAFDDRLPLPAWLLPFDETFPPPPPYGATQSPTHSRVIRQYLKACAEHFAQNGWLDRSVVTVPGVMADGASGRAETRHYAGIARLADERVRTLTALSPQNLAEFGWVGFAYEDLDALIDVWSPPAQFLDPAALAGRQAWLRVDRPPFSGTLHVAAAPIDARVIAWQARRAGAAAAHVGPANRWPASDRATPQDCIDIDPATLIYPGQSFGLAMPIPSARLKQLRRGMQDLAWLTLLDSAGLNHVSVVLSESLCPLVGAQAYRSHYADGAADASVRDEAGRNAWLLARQIMAAALTTCGHRMDTALSLTPADATEAPGGEAIPQPARSPLEQIAVDVHWQRFAAATRRITIAVDGARVRRLGSREQSATEIELTLSLQNGSRAPLGGQVSFETLPMGWEAEAADVPISPIAPGRAGRVKLTARAAVMTWDPGGIRTIPLVFTSDEGQPTPLEARINYVAVSTPPRRPKLDGDLSDWPAAPGNLADHFELVSAGADDVLAPAAATPSPTPARRTQCFVARDSEYLYFGFRCEAASPAASGSSSTRNFVRYEDLVPMDEELVEILLDPANSGSRDPSDLYHIVIKRSGAPFWERGIALDPPVGKRSVWSADVRSEVRSAADHWTAEVAIPLAAFGDLSTRARIWGLNLTRFDAAAQEYSNWAAARGNVYDPMALGNLDLP